MNAAVTLKTNKHRTIEDLLTPYRVRAFAAFGDEAIDPRRDNGQRYRAELEHDIVGKRRAAQLQRAFTRCIQNYGGRQ